MKFSKFIFKSVLFSVSLLSFVSCSDDDDNAIGTTPPIEANNGAYILSSGAYGNNSARISYYDLDKQEVVHNVFAEANGIGLGDTGESMIIYGSKMYVGVYNSGLIYVLDKNCKILHTIKGKADRKLQPRAFETYKGKVYVSLYDGYLARIDTTTMTIDKEIQVGMNPEGIKVANNKIYVANSGGMNSQNGYNNTVSIVDPELQSTREIIVSTNPQGFIMDDANNLYLTSRGTYGKEPKKNKSFQQIDTNTDEVKVLYDGEYAFSAFWINGKIYLLSKEYVNSAPTSKLGYFDFSKNEVVESSFITDGTVITDISDVTQEPVSKDIYIVAANKQNNGSVYVFSSEGKFKNRFDAGGVYPQGIWFVQK